MMNDVIGRLPSNVDVHRRANQQAPVANTMTSMGGSGTSVKFKKRDNNHMVITWQSHEHKKVCDA